MCTPTSTATLQKCYAVGMLNTLMEIEIVIHFGMVKNFDPSIQTGSAQMSQRWLSRATATFAAVMAEACENHHIS